MAAGTAEEMLLTPARWAMRCTSLLQTSDDPVLALRMTLTLAFTFFGLGVGVGSLMIDDLRNDIDFILHSTIMTRVKSIVRPTTGGKLATKRAAKKKVATAKTEPVVAAKEVTTTVRRHKRGVVALRKIKKVAKSTDTCIQRDPFSRLVREIAAKYFHTAEPIRFEKKALELIQAVTEQRTIACLTESYLLTAHRSADMLKAKDIAQREELQDARFPVLANMIRDQLCESTALLLKCEERTVKRQQKVEATPVA